MTVARNRWANVLWAIDIDPNKSPNDCFSYNKSLVLFPLPQHNFLADLLFKTLSDWSYLQMAPSCCIVCVVVVVPAFLCEPGEELPSWRILHDQVDLGGVLKDLIEPY